MKNINNTQYFVIYFLFSFMAACDIPKEKNIPTVDYGLLDIKPEFSGGLDKFYTYIQEHLDYPKSGLDTTKINKVMIEFIIDTDGKISDTKILKGLGACCDEKVENVLKSSPQWKPGRHNGNIVNTRIVLPVTFDYN